MVSKPLAKRPSCCTILMPLHLLKSCHFVEPFVSTRISYYVGPSSMFMTFCASLRLGLVRLQYWQPYTRLVQRECNVKPWTVEYIFNSKMQAKPAWVKHKWRPRWSINIWLNKRSGGTTPCSSKAFFTLDSGVDVFDQFDNMSISLLGASGPEYQATFSASAKNA